jgi:type III secretion protein T
MKQGFEILAAGLTALAMGAPRLLGMHLALPMFGAQSVPGLVRNSYSFSLALFLAPLLWHQMPGGLAPWVLAGLALKETLLGFVLGFLVGLLFHAAQGIGDLVSFQSGAGMSAFFDPSSREETTPWGVLVQQLATALFFAGGGYLLLLGGVFDSYRFWPVFSFIPSFDLHAADMLGRAMGSYLGSICLYAFPVVFSMFLATLCLGLMSRFLPSLNVFTLAMPVQAGFAAFIMALYLGVLGGIFRGQFRGLGALLETARAALSR